MVKKVNIVLLHLRATYMHLAQNLMSSVNNQVSYDYRLLPVFGLLTSSLEAFAEEIVSFSEWIDLQAVHNIPWPDHAEINYTNSFREVIRLLRLGKFHSFDKLAAFAPLLSPKFADRLEHYQRVFSDLRTIRNLVAHPALVHYHIVVDTSSTARNSAGFGESDIFLGTFKSQFPGKDKLGKLMQRGLIKDKELGIDVYTLISQQSIALFFQNETRSFIQEYLECWSDDAFRNALVEYLTPAFDDFGTSPN